MATYYARKAGNINATDVWATTPSGTAGAQTFVAGDVLVSNSFAITVNVSTDLGSTGEVRNDTTGGATAGGSFSLSNGVTLTANVFAGGSATACVTTAGSVAASVVGNIAGGSINGANGISHGSSGTLTVTGNITGGSGANGYGVSVNSTGSLNVTGNVANTTGNAGIFGASTGAITVTGNVSGGSATGNAGGIVLNNSPIVNITGTVTASANSYGILVTSAAAPTISVTGSCVGGGVAGIGSGSGSPAVTATRAKGGPLVGSAVGVSASASSAVSVEEIEYGDLGASPTSGPIRLSDKTSNVAVMYRFNTTKKTLVDTASTSLLPAASDVRFGVSYNSGATTGTCRVPTAANVLQGVLVDATTGTALMTPADFWAYATSSATTAGSMGERLKNAATVASVGQALADALTP